MSKIKIDMNNPDFQKDQIYSFRFSQKYRALALREESYLRLLTLHTAHDSTYK